MLTSWIALVLSFMLRRQLPLALLLIGVGVIFAAFSWAPNILLRPTLPNSIRDMSAVEIPRIASFTLALGIYVLALAIVGAAFLSLRNEL